MSKASDDFDVILNRHNVAQARAQKVVQSWLGPAVNGSNLWDAGDDDKQDSDPEPENLHLGVGAKAPDNDVGFGLKRKPLGGDDKLLEQILGKRAAKEHRARRAAESTPGVSLQKSVSKSADAGSQQLASDSEDEDGRANLIATKAKVKRKREAAISGPNAGHDESDQSDRDEARGNSGRSSRSNGVKTKAQPSSYLDQVLTEKSRKKIKKGK